MNIILIGPTKPYKGGISHYNTLLFNHLSKKYEVDLISWKRRFPKFLYPGTDQIEEGKEYLIKKDKKFILDFLNPVTWLKSFIIIKRKKPDLLILHWVTPSLAHIFWTILFLTKYFTKTKILLICHNVLPHERRLIDRILTRHVFNKVDYFIIHSNEDMVSLKKIKNNPKSILGFLPICEPLKEKRLNKNIKKILKLKKNTVLFFGYIREYKGLKYLIRAMPLVLKEIDCDLLVVGEFWEDKRTYINLIKRLNLENNIKIVSEYVPEDEIGNYFLASNIIILPYVTATQSGIVQLAFNYNKPVITTKVGGLPDSVTNNKTGFIVPPKNPKKLANAIIKFYKQRKEKEFIKHIKKEKNKFSWNKYIHLIENFLPSQEKIPQKLK